MTTEPEAWVARFNEELRTQAPYMSSTVSRARERFGPAWSTAFGETLGHVIGDDEAFRKAVKGYVRFALDATKLQRSFEKELVYRISSYAEAAAEVYHNKEYMEGLYLPGILLSHYLWPHHYEQLRYFQQHFLPLIVAADDQQVVDVGVGTGFYSRQALVGAPDATCTAYDISEHSMGYARRQVRAFGGEGRWRGELRDVVADTPDQQWPFLVSVEVLEHLEDPVEFLVALRTMLRPAGRAFITAAITAPNADHIYLYEDVAAVEAQLVEAGFEVLDWREDIAYEPRAAEPVPRLAAFIVTRSEA